MDDTAPFDVFVSYARADLRSDDPQRRSLPSVVQALRDRGLRVFLDTSDIDSFVSLNATLTAAIERSRYVLAWYSPMYPTRPACRAELTLALIAARTPSVGRPVVLAVNTEGDTRHIVHAEILGLNVLPSPPAEDGGAVAALATKIAETVRTDAKPIGRVEKTAPRWYPTSISPAPNFVGRLTEIWELDACLWPQRGSFSSGVLHETLGNAACLVGLAGSGKTLLVLEYARLLAPAYPGGVFWLPAGGRDDATAEQLEIRRESAFRDIASTLRIATERLSLDDVRQKIRERIEGDGRSCLWIVDDLPAGLDQPTVKRWLGPPSSRTVITTQSAEYDVVRNVQLGPMDPLEALALLSAENPPAAGRERDAAESIVRLLDGHPMALDIARAYLQHHPSYTEFAERLKADSPADVLERAGEFSHNRSIQVVMLSSFSLLNDNGLAALRVACAVPPLPVPESLVRAVAGRDPDLAGKDVELGVDALLNLSLARRTEPGVVQLHSLVNRAGRYLEPESGEKLRPFIAGALFSDLEAVTLADVAGLRHEVRLARESYGAPQTAAELWVHGAALRAELVTGAFHSNLPGWQAQVRAADSITGAASWAATIARCGLSEVLRELGRTEEALSVGQEGLYWSERNHGWADGYTIAAAEAVGLALASLGRRDQALAMFERIRSAYEALGPQGAAGLARTRANLFVLGDREGLTALLNESIRRIDADPEALRTVVQLAPLETQAGRPAAAVRLLSTCLSKLIDMVGHDNPLTCECQVHLAQAYVALEQYSRAEELLRGALAWYGKELGADHATTLATRYQLTEVRARLGDRQVLDAKEAAWAANREAARLFEAGERPAALARAEEALSLIRTLFGSRSPETIVHLNNVAQIAGAINVERAAMALDELLQLRPADDEHRKRDVELLALASSAAAAGARSKGDSPAACHWAERTLHAYDELNGPRSEEAVKAAWNLSMLLDEDGRRSDGMEVFVDRVSYLLAADEATLPSDLQLIREAAGAKTRDSRTRSGAQYNGRQLTDDAMKSATTRVDAMTDAGTPWEAIGEMQQLADEYARRYGSFHPQTLWLNFMLSTSAGRLGEINRDPNAVEAAIEQLRLVSRAQRAQLGENHEAVLATLQNLAGLLSRGHPADAAVLDERCLAMARQLHGAEDPSTVMIALNAVNSALQVNNHTGARAILHSYLEWLTEEADIVPQELLRARDETLALGRRLGMFIERGGQPSAPAPVT